MPYQNQNSPGHSLTGNSPGHETHPETHRLERLIGYALAYNRDVTAPMLVRRKPQGIEIAALHQLDAQLACAKHNACADDIQTIVYEIGKNSGFVNLRDWFTALYEILLGSSRGPRMGSFILLYGVSNTRKLIAQALL